MTPENRGHSRAPSRSHTAADRMKKRHPIGGIKSADDHSTGVNMALRNSDTSCPRENGWP